MFYCATILHLFPVIRRILALLVVFFWVLPFPPGASDVANNSLSSAISITQHYSKAVVHSDSLTCVGEVRGKMQIVKIADTGQSVPANTALSCHLSHAHQRFWGKMSITQRRQNCIRGPSTMKGLAYCRRGEDFRGDDMSDFKICCSR